MDQVFIEYQVEELRLLYSVLENVSEDEFNSYKEDLVKAVVAFMKTKKYNDIVEATRCELKLESLRNYKYLPNQLSPADYGRYVEWCAILEQKLMDQLERPQSPAEPMRVS